MTGTVSSASLYINPGEATSCPMSAALINRSLTTVRTELEFLRDSEVITEALYERLIASIPTKYDKNAASWDVDRLTGGSAGGSAGDKLATNLSKVSLNDSEEPKLAPNTTFSPPAAAPPRPAPKVDPKPLGYCRTLYDYNAQESGDLELKKDDKVAVLEHLSEDWWKGYRRGTSAADAGVFPSNYVTVISQQEFELQRGSAPVPVQDSKESSGEKAAYNDQYAAPALPQYSPNQYAPPMNQQLQPQPSYGGYAQYPPPLTNYYPPPQQQMAMQPAQPMAQDPQMYQQQTGGSHPHLKKFGSKLGNAAIFGAGATIGSDIVNSIF